MTDRAGTQRDSQVARRRRAVSLVEVLIVVGIVLLLFAMLFPGLAHARESARRVMCANNLRQWGVAALAYRHDYDGYLPAEGTYQNHGVERSGTWYNELPLYLDLPPYKDFDGANDAIVDLSNIHVWICPSKYLTVANKSGTGKNQFHYGMNQVLDGLGKTDKPSRDTPGFTDAPHDKPVLAKAFGFRPKTVFMFDIYPNSMAGTPRAVATMYQRFRGGFVGKFHGDYANVLYINGAVRNCSTDDLVTNRDFAHGEIIWNHPDLYWGYPR